MKGWKKMIMCCLSAILAATAFAACGGKEVYARLCEIGESKHYCANFERGKTLKKLEKTCTRL